MCTQLTLFTYCGNVSPFGCSLCRDVKPENIVLEGGKAGGRVYLVDFGGVQAAALNQDFGSTIIGKQQLCQHSSPAHVCAGPLTVAILMSSN